MAINQISIRNSEGNFENLFPLAVNKGGTGATDATTARSNLGAAASSHSHSWSNITDRPSALTYMPVGYVYISWSSTSPASLFGGNWAAITGHFPYFNNGTSTGGSNSPHTHNFKFTYYPFYLGLGTGWNQKADESLFTFGPKETTTKTNSPDSRLINSAVGEGTKSLKTVCVEKQVTTSDTSHLPAYQTFYAWRRTS